MGFDYVSESNFIVRKSGRESDSYYIDYLGVYKVTEIAKLVRLEAPLLKEKYLKYGAVYFDELDVYYFSRAEDAKSAIEEILKKLKSSQKGRIIQLTEAEIEYIRQALINEGVNNIRVSSKVKDNIFKKLNS
ncbi:hypothetical protein CLHUN_08930 [Ruminiclostridium hungatei]|uniref:Uncharacterized protein n=1 Tax=Ruminiclostridium hungatei TaxID=48256 RepID=A0A1V4SNP7_RUMHU|nr:hypothetical protein [Ruminiclostridium hungatei]OPX45518.1 hypothetical protein CLHUN_08930 [Ruminiclostridium hungatei]